jgi:glycosyltransferase involved in cell wall biosynthesis
MSEGKTVSDIPLRWQFSATKHHQKHESAGGSCFFSFSCAPLMRVVVFPYKPPPHHGQSYMVNLMLEGFTDPRHDIQCFLVNARFSSTAVDGGRFRPQKLLLLPRFLARTLWFRFAKSAPTLYFVPAPPLRVAMYRDWAVLIFLRPFFKHLIFHWHAVGMGDWIKTKPAWMQWLTRRALSHADLSIPANRFNEQDAAFFAPKRSVIIPYGIPDPCPHFPEVLRGRRERLASRLAARNQSAAQNPPVRIRLLFLALCIPEKGLFDAIEGVALANAQCASEKIPWEFHLTICGELADPAIRARFDQTLAKLGNPSTIQYAGFLKGDDKKRALAESDIFCFPSYYYAENSPVSLLEAMAYGLPSLTTKFRAIPEMLPENYPGLVDIQSPQQIAPALINLAAADHFELLRSQFTNNFTLEKHISSLAKAFHETTGA